MSVSLVACNDSNNRFSTVDDEETPPPIATLAVTSTAPVDEATEVAINSKVVAVFNNEVNGETVSVTSFTLQGDDETAIMFDVSDDPLTKTATLVPRSDLTNSTKYTATLTTGIEDKAGDSLVEDVVWTFTTGSSKDTTDPELDAAATTPKHDETGVLRNVKLNIVFSEAIDPATVTAANIALTDDGVSVPGTLSYVNPTTVVFSPNKLLKADALHVLELSPKISDLAGNSLIVPTLSFTTGSTSSSSPAAVNLGTAGDYVILAKTGISTTGTTAITGDIAVSPAAESFITGFSLVRDVTDTFSKSSLVTGKVFAADLTSPTPSMLTTAVSDMELAYTDAETRADPDFTELGAGEIGGLTLDPGLYKWGTGVLVTSDVTLNGSENDVWIFQIDQDLKLQDGKAIILTGGALPQNVFWQVAGEVTLQAGTTFNGIILGKTGVVFKSEAELNGRALAQTAVTLISNEVTQPAQ